MLTEFYFAYEAAGTETVLYKCRSMRIDTDGDCSIELTAKARDLFGMLNESPVKEHFAV